MNTPRTACQPLLGECVLLASVPLLSRVGGRRDAGPHVASVPRYDGSLWSALPGEEHVDGRNSCCTRAVRRTASPVLISASTYLGTPCDTGKRGQRIQHTSI